MYFGPLPLAEAQGALLAHSVPVRGGRLKKGIKLGPEEITALAASGIAEVIVARLDPDEADEDEAAGTIAKALAGPGIRLQPVGTGRVNLLASGPGLAVIRAQAVDAINASDPAITLATLRPYQRVEVGAMIATVKIVTYGVKRAHVDAACAAGAGAVALAPPVLKRAVLIETTLADADPGPKGHAVTAERLARLEVSLAPPVRVPHAVAPLAAALRAAEADVILVLTASATSDPNDICPTAIRGAGGVVERFGMPVDPGNLLVLGRIGSRPVVGLPGCARSPALNGADFVLERLICGIPLTAEDIAGMGVGGLLKEIPSRPRPRRLSSDPEADTLASA